MTRDHEMVHPWRSPEQTFDGRVGAVLLHNVSTRRARVGVYHPDGIGESLPSGMPSLHRSCIRTLGQAAAWHTGEFALYCNGDSLEPGLNPRPGSRERP